MYNSRHFLLSTTWRYKYDVLLQGNKMFSAQQILTHFYVVLNIHKIYKK